MMTPNEIALLTKVTQSIGYNLFVDFVHVGFKTDQEFSDWIYADGADLSSYLLSLDSKYSVINVSKILEDTFYTFQLKDHLNKIKADDTSFKFLSKWMSKRYMSGDAIRKLTKLSSGKRNLYSTLICVLLNNTQVVE